MFNLVVLIVIQYYSLIFITIQTEIMINEFINDIKQMKEQLSEDSCTKKCLALAAIHRRHRLFLN